jgi:hypothetical protein
VSSLHEEDSLGRLHQPEMLFSICTIKIILILFLQIIMGDQVQMGTIYLMIILSGHEKKNLMV